MECGRGFHTYNINILPVNWNMLKKYMSLKFRGRAEEDIYLFRVLMFINNGPDVLLYHILKLSVPV